MIKTELTIINKLGLHARAAAKLVSTASAYSCQVKVGYPERMVDGKSIMAVMMLAASKGTVLELHADGDDAEDATQAITDLINRRFDEEE
ncbi:MAG: phosphocarrier protein HPr [Oceanospirillaceae bacterium]|nr:phosphocarrier protein HPr [Oceanospirillaceae bacterium]MBT13151.1 phosphocarrier protein HPr [Oceanospirillaceae bacterium]|tara:strand:+ start:74891 stop:75160 length:270 start_codon:yes stop_codon:yes gene_type:complete